MAWIKPIVSWLANHIPTKDDFNRIEGNILHLNDNKVDKAAGKDLSTNDYTTLEKNKLADIEEGARKSMPAIEILTALKTVDGAGSGIDADTLDGNNSSAFAPANHSHNGYAPTSHANAGSTYGLGSPTFHGHVKTINALTQASHVDGTALAAYQGKILNDKIGWKLLKTQVVTLVNSQYVNVPINLTNYDFIYIKCLASGTLNKTGGNWGYILAGPYNSFISGSGGSTSTGRILMAKSGSGTATGLSANGGIIGIVDKVDNIFHSTSGMGEYSGNSIGTLEGVSISSYYIEGTATIEIYGLER